MSDIPSFPYRILWEERVLRSVAKMDHVRTGGTLLNQKFSPELLADEAGLDGLGSLIRAYFRLDGHHIQFNVVDAATLRAAQAFAIFF